MSNLFIDLLAHAVVGTIALVIIAFLVLLLAHLWRLIKKTLDR
jgi:hypothetical protein